MTSTADRTGIKRRTGFQTVLLVAGLGLCALGTPLPWGGLWLIVPAAVGLSLLTSWRFGARGVVVPIGLFLVSLFVGGDDQIWAWWVPFAALTGTWMGTREEGGGPTSSDRAWMLLPLLLLAATLPRTAPYSVTLDAVRDQVTTSYTVSLDAIKNHADIASWLTPVLTRERDEWQKAQEILPYLWPAILFLWMTLLVTAGRAISAGVAAMMRWPSLSRSRLLDWRLPDGAIWLLLAGLALVVSPWKSWAPTAWTLIIITVLAYCVQGVAVVESLLLARGLPGSLVVLTMLFVITLALPAFILIAAAMGISDVWLDYRRLESGLDPTDPGA